MMLNLIRIKGVTGEVYMEMMLQKPAELLSFACCVGDFLRILPRDSSSLKLTTIWENIFLNFLSIEQASLSLI